MNNIRAERAYVKEVTDTATVIKLYRGGIIKIPIRPEWKKFQALVVSIEPRRNKPHEVLTLDEYNARLNEEHHGPENSEDKEWALDPYLDGNEWYPNPLTSWYFSYLGEECALIPSCEEVPEWLD